MSNPNGYPEIVVVHDGLDPDSIGALIGLDSPLSVRGFRDAPNRTLENKGIENALREADVLVVDANRAATDRSSESAEVVEKHLLSGDKRPLYVVDGGIARLVEEPKTAVVVDDTFGEDGEDNKLRDTLQVEVNPRLYRLGNLSTDIMDEKRLAFTNQLEIPGFRKIVICTPVPIGDTFDATSFGIQIVLDAKTRGIKVNYRYNERKRGMVA